MKFFSPVRLGHAYSFLLLVSYSGLPQEKKKIQVSLLGKSLSLAKQVNSFNLKVCTVKQQINFCRTLFESTSMQYGNYCL